MRLVWIAVAIAVLAGGYLVMRAPSDREVQAGPASGSAIVAISLPDTFSDSARIGQTAFNAKCAACHGPTAGGIEGAGPPLVHVIYEPSHHADVAFFRAAEMGVRAHHWTFGNMPPVEGITRAEIGEIVAYLRAVQRANGIY